MRSGATTLTQQNQGSGANQRIKKTETAGTSPTDVVEYFYQDGEVLYTYCANNPVKYSDPSGHFIWFAIGAAMAICDGVSAYHKAKKQGKTVKKLEKKLVKKTYKRASSKKFLKKTVSKAGNGKKKAPTLSSKGKTYSAHGSSYSNSNQSNIVGNKGGVKSVLISKKREPQEIIKLRTNRLEMLLIN